MKKKCEHCGVRLTKMWTLDYSRDPRGKRNRESTPYYVCTNPACDGRGPEDEEE